MTRPEPSDPLDRDPQPDVNAFIRRFGEAVGTDLGPLDETGFAEVRCGDVPIGINANTEHGVLLLLARVGDLPREAPAAFYRRLLELNFVSTGPCAFAIDESRRKVYLRAMRPLRDMSYGEFERLLHALAAAAEQALGQLQLSRGQAVL